MTSVDMKQPLRKIRKDEEENIIHERIADPMLRNSSRDFWSEVKRLRDHKSCISRTIDGQTEDHDIVKFVGSKISRFVFKYAM